MLPSQAVGTAWKLAHACHSMRPVPLLSPPASYEPQMQGTENHGRRTPKCKVSWAGRLSPGMYSRDVCLICATLVQYRSVVVCVRSDLVMLDGFSAGQQASGGSTLRLECGV